MVQEKRRYKETIGCESAGGSGATCTQSAHLGFARENKNVLSQPPLTGEGQYQSLPSSRAVTLLILF